MTLIGVHLGYPPTDRRWPESHAARGYVVEPDDPDVANNLVVGLAKDDDVGVGTASGLWVRYEANGVDYRYATSNSIELREGGCFDEGTD